MRIQSEAAAFALIRGGCAAFARLGRQKFRGDRSTALRARSRCSGKRCVYTSVM
jgi:hypothetical protein